MASAVATSIERVRNSEGDRTALQFAVARFVLCVENCRHDWGAAASRGLVSAWRRKPYLWSARGEARRATRKARSKEMPFDGIEVSGTEQLVKLGAVERMLATEQQWCKGRLRDA